MTTTPPPSPSTTCPHCGAEKSTFEGQTSFKCGTYIKVLDDGYEWMTTEVCKTIQSLRQQLMERDANDSASAEWNGLTQLLRDAKGIFRCIQQIAASSDGGPLIMDGRRGMVVDMARHFAERIELVLGEGEGK